MPKPNVYLEDPYIKYIKEIQEEEDKQFLKDALVEIEIQNLRDFLEKLSEGDLINFLIDSRSL